MRTPKAQPATIHPTRSFAILHAAIYDAVVSITRDGSPYGFRLTAPRTARPDAAAAAAGHDVLAALYPARGDELDRQLAAELAAIPDGTGKEQGITVGRNAAARMLADLDLALADGTIAFYDAKYHYHVWRPITAIREGPGGADPSWTPLATTPADPSYPGAHSVISSAASTVLTSYFGERNEVVVTSEVLPGVVRSFGSYHDAAIEAGLSRILAGLHTRLDHDSGLRLGHQVAIFVMDHDTSAGDGR